MYFHFSFLESFGLTNPDYYYYLNQSGTYKVDGTNDTQEFGDTLVSFVFHRVQKVSWRWLEQAGLNVETN